MLGIPYIEKVFEKVLAPVKEAAVDTVDVLLRTITPCFLIFFSIMVSAKQYIGSPIQCWMPMEFKGGWEQYAEDYCFISNTYYVPFQNEIPAGNTEREQQQLPYYQWVPIVLALQAIFCYLPHILWTFLNKQTGIGIEEVVNSARVVATKFGPEKQECVNNLAEFVEQTLGIHDEPGIQRRLFCFRFGGQLRSSYTIYYLMTKLLCLLNVFCQLYLMQKFLGAENAFWGFETVVNLWHGREWHESGFFPRVTLCDFRVRRLANIHRYTVQCVLMINMFNEKIYAFLWCWFILIGIAAVINFFYLVITLCSAPKREKNARIWLRRIIPQDEEVGVRSSTVVRFARNVLGVDGTTVMKTIQDHAGEIPCRAIVEKMFQNYVAHESQPFGTQSTSPGCGVNDGLHEKLYSAEKVPMMYPPQEKGMDLEQYGGLCQPDSAS